ncbi:hypothetical protein [Arthrobacter sp. SO5]|uniref:hypothetical protein n=1 Tax=Arthrobacter sp. SO5 TaxID=1897055 RepID=UPI001E57DF0A|nr:hypothetical protein [Arthrobacter sp. SO5]
MTVTWTPRLDITRNNGVVGWLRLKPVTTQVLPRIGEVVSFDELLPEELRLNSYLSYRPQVVSVEHWVGKKDNELRVVVRVTTDGSVDHFKAIAERNDLDWTPNDRK